ncbi:MAG: FecR domain-containing protein [Spirochaetia bacterium]|nr:FecR domain-containing protein [Spirochaetia bacterium]
MKQMTLAVGAILLTLTACSEPKKWDTRITAVKGQVSVEREGKAADAKVGEVIKTADVIVTKEASSADLLIQGGGVLRISENSRMSIASMKQGASYKLDQGRIVLGLNKLEKTDNVEVVTPTAIASVRGTAFGISSGDKLNKISVLTGAVAVESGGKKIDVDQLKEVRMEKDKPIKAEKLQGDSAEELKEILTIEGVEKLDGFDDLQKNVSLSALEGGSRGLYSRSAQSREHREK